MHGDTILTESLAERCHCCLRDSSSWGPHWLLQQLQLEHDTFESSECGLKAVGLIPHEWLPLSRNAAFNEEYTVLNAWLLSGQMALTGSMAFTSVQPPEIPGRWKCSNDIQLFGLLCHETPKT